MFNFEELRVYQESLIFVNTIYEMTKAFPKDEIFGLTNQLRRAAVSISLNIAEGSSRTKKDFSHFLNLSRGSCYECVAVLTIAKNQQYISSEQFKLCYDHSNKISRMINGLKNSLQ